MQILRISRVVAELSRAEAFYCEALQFRAIDRSALPGDAAGESVLQLGRESAGLVEFAEPGAPYPVGSRSNDLWFQHLAIVVRDMNAAYAHLQHHPGWSPISEGGPQTLPPANGGVRAFKFRDPDGHPLELIWFPPGQGRAIWQAGQGLFLGIDHSALAVSDVAQSLDFYTALGFTVASRSRNEGPAQSRLDGLSEARLDVIGLRPASDTGPGLELLAYDTPGRPSSARLQDTATDWVTLAAGGEPRALRDPDGHRLLLA